MKINTILAQLVLFILLFAPPFASNAQTPCKEVIGYYPGWQWYDRDKLVNPESIDYSKYTIINYAFLYPLEDGTLTITDPWSDKNLLLGAINWAVAPAGYDSSYDLGNPDYHHPGTSLIHHAHTNGVDVMISIGGWTLSNDFPAIAADPTKRSNFAHWCNELVRIYDIDGIDVDWEYPGYEAHAGTPADIVNYTLLLQEVRDSLDAIEPVVSKDLLLTAAFGAAPDRMDDIEWDNIIEILDYINLMSYDFFGAFSPETNHNSPLYEPASGDPTFNTHSAIERLINDYSVPEEMINMGIAFYGRTAKTTGPSGLHVPTTGATDNVTFAADEGSPQYYNILSNMDLFEREWDDAAKVPYLNGLGGLNTFVSYDDEESIGIKAQYVVDRYLAGVIIWEITGDYIETSPGSGIIAGTPLADTLNLVLCHEPTGDDDDDDDDGGDDGGSSSINEENLSEIAIYPNPAHDNIRVITTQKIQSLKICSATGKEIQTIVDPKEIINVSDLPIGVYILLIQAENQLIQAKFIKQ